MAYRCEALRCIVCAIRSVLCADDLNELHNQHRVEEVETTNSSRVVVEASLERSEIKTSKYWDKHTSSEIDREEVLEPTIAPGLRMLLSCPNTFFLISTFSTMDSTTTSHSFRALISVVVLMRFIPSFNVFSANEGFIFPCKQNFELGFKTLHNVLASLGSRKPSDPLLRPPQEL